MADDAAPWKSKGAVNRAGMAVRNGTQTEDDVATINAWRAAHFVVLNTFQALLRTKIKVIGTDAKIGQRHKRRNTIFDKLTRLPDMQLAALQDVAGCRVIFHTLVVSQFEF
jgi:(p)ppGpp synthase/HD superfamily hydrolase